MVTLGLVPPLDRIGPSLPAVARRAIAEFLGGEGFVASDPEHRGAPQAPVFVTLRTSDGALRGCIGSLVATHANVVMETARSAVLAATRDPRFPPVSSPELGLLTIEVSVLGPEERIDGVAELDPRRYGVIVRDAFGRQGLLLPDIPGIEDAGTQVEIARRKAGIHAEASVRLYRFQVEKWDEAPR